MRPVPPACFVTGASGFVGRHLLPLLAQQWSLRTLVRPGQRLTTNDGQPTTPIEGRLDDENALRAGVDGADLVVHLAALVSFRREDHAAMQRINVDNTATLARLAREAGVRRFLHVSTISAVGCTRGPTPLDETAPFNFAPLRIGYCDSQFAAEQRVLAEVARGLDAVIVNPPSMYGAGDRRKGDGSLLSAVLAGQVKWAPPGGLNVANVADVCDGIVRAIERGRRGERYILGGENLTGLELMRRIATIVGGAAPRRAAPRWLVERAADALALKERLFGSRPPVTSQILRLASRFLWYSSEKAARELDWRAGSVDNGIAAAWRELQDPSPA